MIFSFFSLFWYGNGKQTSWVLLVKCQVKRKIYLLPAAVSSVFSWVKKDDHNEHNQAQIQAICGEEQHTKGENTTTNWPSFGSSHTPCTLARHDLEVSWQKPPSAADINKFGWTIVDGHQNPIVHVFGVCKVAPLFLYSHHYFLHYCL